MGGQFSSFEKPHLRDEVSLSEPVPQADPGERNPHFYVYPHTKVEQHGDGVIPESIRPELVRFTQEGAIIVPAKAVPRQPVPETVTASPQESTHRPERPKYNSIGAYLHQNRIHGFRERRALAERCALEYREAQASLATRLKSDVNASLIDRPGAKPFPAFKPPFQIQDTPIPPAAGPTTPAAASPYAPAFERLLARRQLGAPDLNRDDAMYGLAHSDVCGSDDPGHIHLMRLVLPPLSIVTPDEPVQLPVSLLEAYADQPPPIAVKPAIPPDISPKATGTSTHIWSTSTPTPGAGHSDNAGSPSSLSSPPTPPTPSAARAEAVADTPAAPPRPEPLYHYEPLDPVSEANISEASGRAKLRDDYLASAGLWHSRAPLGRDAAADIVLQMSRLDSEAAQSVPEARALKIPGVTQEAPWQTPWTDGVDLPEEAPVALPGETLLADLSRRKDLVERRDFESLGDLMFENAVLNGVANPSTLRGPAIRPFVGADPVFAPDAPSSYSMALPLLPKSKYRVAHSDVDHVRVATIAKGGVVPPLPAAPVWESYPASIEWESQRLRVDAEFAAALRDGVTEKNSDVKVSVEALDTTNGPSQTLPFIPLPRSPAASRFSEGFDSHVRKQLHLPPSPGVVTGLPWDAPEFFPSPARAAADQAAAAAAASRKAADEAAAAAASRKAEEEAAAAAASRKAEEEAAAATAARRVSAANAAAAAAQATIQASRKASAEARFAAAEDAPSGTATVTDDGRVEFSNDLSHLSPEEREEFLEMRRMMQEMQGDLHNVRKSSTAAEVVADKPAEPIEYEVDEEEEEIIESFEGETTDVADSTKAN